MAFDNDESFPIEDFAEFIQKMLTESILLLQKDSHIKILSVKFPFILKQEFFKKIINIEEMTDIIEKHVTIDENGFDKKRSVDTAIVKLIINDMLLEMKNRIFSELAELGKMALFFDDKHDKFFWSFLDERKVPNEKDIINKKFRRK